MFYSIKLFTKGVFVGRREFMDQIKLDAAMRATRAVIGTHEDPTLDTKLGQHWIIIGMLANRLVGNDGVPGIITAGSTVRELAENVFDPETIVMGELSGEVAGLRKLIQARQDEGNFALAALSVKLIEVIPESFSRDYIAESDMARMMSWLEYIMKWGFATQNFNNFEEFGWESRKSLLRSLRLLKAAWAPWLSVVIDTKSSDYVKAHFQIPGYKRS